MNYWLKNVRIETSYRKEKNWISGTETKKVAIEIKEGKFVRIVADGDFLPDPFVPVIDSNNQLILPGLIEKHCHLDKSKLGTPWRPVTPAKTIVECFEAEIPYLDSLSVPLEVRAQALIDLELVHGVTKFRTHVDVEPMTGLRHFDEVQALAQTKKFPIEIVVFPQHGLLRAHSSELVEEALKKGAQYIGGVDPYSLDGDYQASLAKTFRLAAKYKVGVDIHLHDRDEAGTKTIEEIIRLTKQYRMQNQVFISHAFGLNDFFAEKRQQVFTELAKEQIHIVSSVPITPATLPPIMELIDYGVQVHLDCDNINDCWSPYGDGSIQQRLARLGEIFDVKDQAELTQLLGLITDGVTTLDKAGKSSWPKVGDEATYILTQADCTAEFVARQNPVTTSVFQGEMIYQLESK